ncbi:hypothetical protein HBA54_04845 [Pelagibius litoralis]|uniref:Uncharacterized protein n=1 Tax=Pelagibius litoralis TaxID=374515 RepID=A0A967C263_9PROT|nr:hypothetical protein [Pelagibius litoralis]NIA67913.1 hypothetical protein [Pelagibius litoralis]
MASLEERMNAARAGGGGSAPPVGPQTLEQRIEAARQETARSREPEDGIVLRTDRPLLDRAKDFAGGVADAFEGQSEFDLPELGTVFGNRTMLGGVANPSDRTGKQYPLDQRAKMETVVSGLALARDPQGQINIIREQFPEARFSEDRFGNPIVRIGDERFYVNRSGFSGQDARGLIAEGGILAGTMNPAARAGGVVAGGIGRLTGAGAGGFAGSVVQDLAARGAGSGQQVDLGRAAMTGATGMGFEGALMALQRIPGLRAVFGSPALYRQGSGLTDRGRNILRDSGINPDEISPAMADQLSAIARQTDDVAAAARQAEAQTLPNPVSLTGAQAARNPTAMALEGEAKKGVLGQEAQSLLLDTQAQQQAALRGNIPAIQSRLSGGQAQVAQPGQGAAGVQDSLVAQREAARRGVDQAYDTARAASETAPAFFGGQAVSDLGRTMRQAVQSYDPQQFANMANLLKSFDQITKAAPGTRVSGVNLNALEAWRRRATTSAGGAASKQEAAGIRAMIRQYDDALEGQLKDALLSGDEATIQLWKTARSARSRFGQIFEQDDVVKELTAPMRDGSRRLAVGPDDAVNYVFGRSGIGAKKGLERDLVKLRDTLGPDSAEWNAIREEAFLRLFRNQPSLEAGGVFNAQAFSKELTKALTDSSAAMRVLFSNQEKALMRTLSRTAINMNTTPAIAANANPSGTAFAARLTDAFGPLGRRVQGYVANVLAGSRRGAAMRELTRSTAGNIPRLPSPGVPGLGGAVGATAVDRLPEEKPPPLTLRDLGAPRR